MANWNINTIYNTIRNIIRKERGVFATIPEVMQYLDNGQMETYEDYFKLYGINQVIHDALKKFKTTLQFTSAADGSVTYEDNYLHLLDGVYTVTGSTVNKVRFVNTDELPVALTSQLRQVTLAKPIAVDNSSGFSLYPQSLQRGFYSYMRRPETPDLVYSQIGRVITYDSGASTQLEFTDAYINNVIAKALKPLGINLDDDKIEAFAQMQQQQTS